MEQSDLVILNHTQRTRYNIVCNAVNDRRSLLDLSLASMDLAHRSETIVSEHFFDSDHRIVTTKIDCRSKEASQPIQRWNLRKAKWNVFTKSASLQLSMLTKTADVDQFNDDSAALIRTADVAIPKILCKLLFKNPVPWWND